VTDFQWVAAVAVAVASIARTARLLIHDSLPPMVWLRSRIVARYKADSDWATLWECQYCMTPYLAAGMGLWMWVSDLNTVWWVVNGGWAASYAAAIVVSYDQPE
jgi:hypothetical protein